MHFYRCHRIERATERIHDAPGQCRPYRHGHHLAGAANPVSGLDAFDMVEQNASNGITIQSDGESDLAMLESQEFVQPPRHTARIRGRFRRRPI